MLVLFKLLRATIIIIIFDIITIAIVELTGFAGQLAFWKKSAHYCSWERSALPVAAGSPPLVDGVSRPAEHCCWPRRRW